MAKKKVKEPKYIMSPMNNRMINYNVYYFSKAELLLSIIGTFLIGGFVGWIFYGGLFKEDGVATTATQISNVVIFCLIGGIAARVFVPAVRNMLKNRRDKALRIQFRDMLETLAAALAAGSTMSDAFVNTRIDLGNQYSRKDYIMVEMAEILDGMQNGLTLETMLDDFGKRANNEDIQNFANVIANCYRMGGDFKSIVRKTRQIISDKMAIEEEIATKIASNKLQHNAMCFMPVVIVVMLKLTNESFANNLASLLGVVATTVAVGIFIGAYFWGRKIVDIR